MRKSWSDNESLDEAEECHRSLKAATGIFLEIIRSVPENNEIYTPPCKVFENSKFSDFVSKEDIWINGRSRLDILKIKCAALSFANSTPVRSTTGEEQESDDDEKSIQIQW